MNFYKAFRKFRTANTKLEVLGNMVYFDANSAGKARATMFIEDGAVSFQLNTFLEGKPIWVEANALKNLNRIETLRGLKVEAGILEWQGEDLTMRIPELDKEAPNLNPVIQDYDAPSTGTISQDDLKYVLRAVSDDPDRPVLNGIYFGEDSLAATDGFRIHFMQGKWGNGALVAKGALERISRNCTYSHHEDHSIFSFTQYGIDIAVRAIHIEGSFPKYQDLIPDITDKEDHHPFPLVYAKWMYKTKGDDIMKFSITPKEIEIDSVVDYEDHSDFEDGIHTLINLPGTGLGHSTAHEFAVNPQFIYDAMQGRGTEAWVYNRGSTKPVYIVGPLYKALIMPMHCNAID